MTRRSIHNRLQLIAILFAMSGAAAFAEPLSSPPTSAAKQPTIRDVKVRPQNGLPDGGSSLPPSVGKSLPDTDVKRIRTTRERNTDEPGPAGQPLRPPASQQ